MKVRNGIISAIAGTSLLGGVGIAALAAGGSGAASASIPTATLASATVSATPAPAPASPGCGIQDDGGWPGFVNGMPDGFDAGSPAGVYLWHSEDGWHLRVTHANDTHQVYTGLLTTSGTFSDVDAVKLEGSDHFAVGPKDHAIVYRFNNYGGVDGIDFRTHSAPSITFELRADGKELQTFQVHLGENGLHPTSVPFTVQRSE